MASRSSRPGGGSGGGDRRKGEDSGAGTSRRVNEYFIEGEGLNREVLQSEICRFLGPDATLRPAEHKGVRGYMIKAYRPFTPEMLKDLRDQSSQYEAEMAALPRKNARSSGREGSHDYKRSPRGSNQNIAMDYPSSETRKQFEAFDSSSRYGAPPQVYGSAPTPYGQEVHTHGMQPGYGQPPQGYGGPPPSGYDAPPYGQQSYPPGYSMAQPPAGMTAPADTRYQPSSDPRYGGQPPYGYGAAPPGNAPYSYPQGSGYQQDTQMSMDYNEPPRGHHYSHNPSDRGSSGDQRGYGGGAMAPGMVSPSGDMYGHSQAQPFGRQEQPSYGQPPSRGSGHSSRQTESSYSSSRTGRR